MPDRNFSFAIFFTLIGVGLGCALLFTGILTSPERLQFFYQPRGLGILFGGICLSLYLGISAQTRADLRTLTWDVLTDSAEPNAYSALNECVMLATRTREAQGQELKLYRELKPYLQHSTLRLGLDFLVAAYPKDLLKETLEHHRDQRLLVYRQCADALAFLGRSSIAFGVVAAAVGLMRSHVIAEPNLPFYMGGIGLPLALGVLGYAILFLPLQQKIRQLEQVYSRYESLLIQGVLLLQGQHHAHYVETLLRAYLPPQQKTAVPTPTKETTDSARRPVAASQDAPKQAPAHTPVSSGAETKPNFQEALEESYPSDEPLNRSQLSQFRPVKRNLPPP